MNYIKIFQRTLREKYYTRNELLYDKKVGILLSPFDYQNYLTYKDELIEEDENHSISNSFNLKTFTPGKIHFFLSSELILMKNTLLQFAIEDYTDEKSIFNEQNKKEIRLGHIYSEVEGTLNLENVPTTRKCVEEISNGKRTPTNLNEQIIQNMINGIRFVETCPPFNEENLFKLYTILSDGCLDEEDQLLPGHIYRHDGVEVGDYKGCPFEKVPEAMNSLFNFVNENLNKGFLSEFLPHIAHYYVVYIHPYFDYNGRTARMVSYWINLLQNKKGIPTVISEAINQNKNYYHLSLSETRDAHNDLTYFLLYIYKVIINYYLTFKNIDEIDQKLKNNSVVLTNNEKNYLKKILISYKGSFLYQDFLKWIGVDMSKQGAFKILNAFESYGILTSKTSRSNQKLFDINESIITYQTKQFN